MTKFKLASIALFIIGLVLFLAGTLTGDTKVFLAVIIPIVQTSNPLSIIGILMMFASFFLWFFGRFREAGYERVTPSTKPKTGGIILIGPIPIVFSNDRALAKILMVLAVIAIVIILFFLIFFL